MNEQSIYKDIALRTGGDIYIGVVGPVRTGKSTFIKRFMEELVIPNISDGYSKERAVDELPQSAQGKTVMTTGIITFIDGGVPYDPLAAADPDTTLSAEDRAIGGLGIFMVKKSMDEITYRYENGSNILSIRKNLRS